MLEKLDIYRIAEPIFRVHARLFKVQEAILRASRQQIRASKLGILAQGAVYTSLVLFLLALVINVLDLSWTSTPVLLLMLVALVAIGVHWYDFAKLKETEEDFDRLIDDAGGEDSERWVDYAQAIAAAYGTRLKMIDDMEEELLEQHEKKKLTERKYAERVLYYKEIRTYCIEKLAYYKRMNEDLYKKKRRTLEDYKAVSRFISVAEIGIQPEETCVEEKRNTPKD